VPPEPAALIADQARIRALIPHAGAMCLLDAVLAMSECAISCRASSHRDPSNPLASNGRLSALHLVEYGAQAAAVHGGLLAAALSPEARTVAGVLAAVRDLQLEVATLDDLTGVLQIDAARIAASPAGQQYQFSASCEGRALARGRVLIMNSP